MEVTPTRKTPQLKSLVQRGPAAKSYQNPPYKSLETDPREFIRYLIKTLDCKAYDTKIRCLAIFFSQSTVLAHPVIASTITTLVAANRGVHFLMPFSPIELMLTPANPMEAEPPGPPVCSNDYQTDVRVKFRREWTYLMHLLQYWHNTSTIYTYGGPVKQESKLMLYIFYRINAMLNPYSIYIWLHEVMDNTPWLHYYQDCTWSVDHIVDYESHLHVIKGLEILQNWLRNQYLVEAMAEWRHLTLHDGSLEKMPYLHSYKDQWPSNEGPFYCNRGICPEIEPTPEDAPHVANTMLEALACHNCWQTEARDHQEYQWWQDNTESPITNFPSPTLVDQEEPTDLGGLEGATTVPSHLAPLCRCHPRRR